MRETNQLRAGALLSYVNLAISSLIPFFYTPVMLRMLGDSEYGLYSLSNSVISYLSLLSFGFGGTIVRYISMYRAKNEKENVEKIFGFFLLLYCGIAIIVIASGIALSGQVEAIFHRGLTDIEIGKMRTLMLIMAFNSALSFPVSVFSSVVISYEKYIFRKLVDMLATIAAPLANLIVLYLGFASVGMAWTSTVIQFVMLPLNAFYCLKVLNVKPKFKRVSRDLVHELLGFSALVFIGQIVDMLFWATDKVILGMLASSTAVAVYNIGCTFNGMVTSLSSSVSGVLIPKVTAMVTTDSDINEVSDLFIRVGRIQYIIVALVVSGFIVFGQQFVFLWAGENYAQSYWIALLTMLPLTVPLIQNTGLSIITAQNKHGFRAVVYLIIAIVNVISTYFLVPSMGGIGAALCSAVSYIVGQGIIMNVYYYKVTGIDIPEFWKNIGWMSVVPAILLVLGLFITHKIPNMGWGIFFVLVVVYSMLYVLGMYFFGMNQYEKDIIQKPILKILKKKHEDGKK